MFESLSQKLNLVLNKLSSKGRLTEQDVDEGLRDVRIALLEADVNFRVVKEFIDNVREKAVGSEIFQSISPGQQLVKVVHDEIVEVLGGVTSNLEGSGSTPSILMLVGLQGSGKTTTAAKLALYLKQTGHKVLLVAADVRRPAAIDQLEILGKQIDIPVYSEKAVSDSLSVSVNGLKRARETNVSWVILDTAGRIHIDDEMMEELDQINITLTPTEKLLVLDSMTGQDAVNSAQSFHEKIGLSGLVMTKLDGDARGGAALSVNKMTHLPIKFIGTGEDVNAIEVFHPDRLASRILGMGDIVTLVERAQKSITEEHAKEMERKIRKATFDLEDFLDQIQHIKEMGPLNQILEMIPGFSSMSNKISSNELDVNHMKSVEAIIYSMTSKERRNPDLLNGSRRRRIALGSGTSPQQVNQLLNQFRAMQKMMKSVSSGNLPKTMRGMFR